MIHPQVPGNEEQRLRALHEYFLLDTPDEKEFDRITTLVSQICGTPISAITLIDEKRQWFKSKKGLSVNETEREVSFCAHAICEPGKVMLVNDARKDERFFDNPLVTGSPNVVFYAGIPLVDEHGYALGTLCAIDNKPREISQEQVQALESLSEQVIILFKARKQNRELEKSRAFLFECISSFSPYFLLLNAQGEIVELGSNFIKLKKEITKGSLFSDWFLWESSFQPEKLLSGSSSYNTLLFFTTHDGKQRFKCSVKRNDNNSYFILSNPVINTRYPITNYSINVSDFPKHDYIAEYLFLQQAATRGLDDAARLNQLLKERNAQLEVSKNALITANAVLEERISQRTKELRYKALFPEQNPNPVFELDYKNRKVNYINPAAKTKIKNVENLTYDQLVIMFDISSQIIEKRNSDKREFSTDDNIYERNMFFIEENNVLRIYLHDITEIRKQEKKQKEENEKFIVQQNALLEMRSIPQNYSLADKLKFISRKTAEILNCDRCSVWFYNEEKSSIKTEFVYLKSSNSFTTGAVIESAPVQAYFHALNKKAVIDATDAETHPATNEFAESYLRPLKIKSMLDIPLIQTAESIGVICNEYLEKKDIFSSDEVSFARSVADVIVLAYETELLKISKEELSEKNKSLKAAMDRLLDMQNDIIQQEKLATLGMLIAGIAHEINTPLGAIKASNENLNENIKLTLLEKMGSLTKEDLDAGIKLFSLCKNEKSMFSTREERQHIKTVEVYLSEKYPSLSPANVYARKLVEMGMIHPGDELEPYFLNENRLNVFAFAENMHKIDKSINTISLAVNKASKVLKALNSFSHGNIEKEISSFNLHDSIDSVITLLWNKIKYNAVVNNSINQEVLITANPEELSQVWTNILNNALQASNNKCNIWIDYALENNRHVISIGNDGPPIPAEILPKIFDAFFSTKKRGEGTGLGLNIVKNIVEKNKGEIFCTSNEQRTTFVVTLPNI